MGWTLPEMGFWESVIIVSVFSFVVIVMDEFFHSRRKRLRERDAAVRQGH